MSCMVKYAITGWVVLWSGLFWLDAQSTRTLTATVTDVWDCAGGASCQNPIGILDGRNALFTLRYAPANQVVVDVYVNGLHQRVVADYSLTQNSSGAFQFLKFNSAPAVGDSVDVRYRRK